NNRSKSAAGQHDRKRRHRIGRTLALNSRKVSVPAEPRNRGWVVCARSGEYDRAVMNQLNPETTMIRKNSLRVALALSVLAVVPAIRTPVPARAQNQHMEVIHHPNYDQSVFMPFVPAIKIKSGKILWLAGTTALPVYHDHPHKRDQIQQYMVNDL